MKPFDKFLIYYFSGTGNSKNVAMWVNAAASKYGIDSQVINIANTDRLHIENPPAEALVIFISPIHGFNYPPIMLNFILHFPKGDSKVVLMNTRAGMLIGKYITPGLTGIAFYLSAFVLKLKGYSISGMIPVDLPSNWTSVHPGLNDRTIKYLHEKNKERVTLSVEKILTKGKDFKALKDIIQDIIISPVSILYYFIGRFCIAKSNFASAKCNSCDLCTKECPVKAIIKVDRRPYWTFKCESCMKCMSNCPKKAIETAHGFFGGIIILNSAVMGLFYKYFNPRFIQFENGFVKFVFENIIFLCLIGISYRICHYCMRFKFFERIMVFTSLTRYKFWGKRYKALKES